MNEALEIGFKTILQDQVGKKKDLCKSKLVQVAQQFQAPVEKMRNWLKEVELNPLRIPLPSIFTQREKPRKN